MKLTVEKKNAMKVIGRNLPLFLLLICLIYINKSFLRSTFNENQFEQILTGSFHNFIAALLISLCAVNPVLIRRPKYGRLIVYLGSLSTMTVLILDEIKSIGASTQFDSYDIAGTIMGAVLAVLIFEYLKYRQKPI